MEQLGLPGKAVGQIPPSAGKVKVMSANEVSALQDATRILSGLATWLFPLTLALFAFAVFLARGRRRAALMYVGVDLIAAGVLVLIIRNVAGDSVVSSLAATPSVEPAASAVWSIGTQMLRDVAGACVIIGIPVVIAAWLAGPMRPAPAIRNWAAPWLIERPGVAYGLLFALLALIVAGRIRLHTEADPGPSHGAAGRVSDCRRCAARSPRSRASCWAATPSATRLSRVPPRRNLWE